MAILVYACAATRQFALVGGEAIRGIAPPTFWEQVRGELQRHFEDERYCDGLFKAVAQVAIELQRHTVMPREGSVRLEPSDEDHSMGGPPAPDTEA